MSYFMMAHRMTSNACVAMCLSYLPHQILEPTKNAFLSAIDKDMTCCMLVKNGRKR